MKNLPTVSRFLMLALVLILGLGGVALTPRYVKAENHVADDGNGGDDQGGQNGQDEQNDGKLHTAPPNGEDPDEVDAASLIAGEIFGEGCSQTGEVLRRISNHLLTNAGLVPTGGHQRDDRHGNQHRDQHGDHHGGHRDDHDLWQDHLRDPIFLQKLWDRLGAMYRQCGKTCFDDGIAIGQISGAGYCSASIALGGLDALQAIPQASLPLCQNSIFIGCQVGYRGTVSSFSGCSIYASGKFESVYKSFVSQDCHL